MLARARASPSLRLLALALGIGANTAIFRIVNAALIERLPFQRSVAPRGRLGRERAAPRTCKRRRPDELHPLEERAQSFEEHGRLRRYPDEPDGRGDPEELTVQNVTAGFFSDRGRLAGDGPHVHDAETPIPTRRSSILSHALWQRRFGGDGAIVGRTIQLNGKPNTVVGVMPPGIPLTMKSNSLVGKPIDLWAPWVLPAERTRCARALHVGHRAPQTRDNAAAGANRDERDCRGADAEIPVIDSGWAVRGLFDSQRALRPSASGAPDAPGRRCVRAADRVRERREPAARARRSRASERSRFASALGQPPPPGDSPVADRKRCCSR